MADEAARSLLLLNQLGQQHEQTLLPINQPPSDSDSDEEEHHPMITSYCEEGGPAIFLNNTAFTEKQFFELHSVVEDDLETRFKSGRGSRHKNKPTDLFFMFLAVFKKGGTWSDLAFAFRQNKTTFETNIITILEVVHPILYKTFVKDVALDWRMRDLEDSDVQFKNNRWCLYATDVRFQQSFRPTGTHEESKPYYSAKHKLYGYKCEVSVLPNGMCIRSSKHDLGGKSDISIFRTSLGFHKKALEKSEDEEDIYDDGILKEEYPNMWGVVVDKGYQGLQHDIRALHPKKKPINGRFTTDDVLSNTQISSDRVIVERFFGREVSLWSIMERQFKWSEDKYDMVSRTCRALTNYHILHNPLNAGDESSYSAYRDRLYEKGVLRNEKRKSSQQKYRERRRQKLSDRWEAAVQDD